MHYTAKQKIVQIACQEGGVNRGINLSFKAP
jgi:hypothetical protein